MTRIQLEGFGFIDTQEGTSFPLNFNIQNLLDSSTTPSSYSKNITIVGTKATNRILGHAFDVNISNSSFDVNKKVKCVVLQDDVSVFDEAFFQLITIDKSGNTLPNGEDEVIYTGRVKSNLMSFFNDVKNKELRELRIGNPQDFHVLSQDAIFSRMNNTAVDQWKYITYYNAGQVFKISDFKPAIFAKTYWDAIHEQNGYEYEFDEISALRFDKLLIPSVEKYENNDEIKNQRSFIHETNFRSFVGNTPVGNQAGNSGIQPGTGTAYQDRWPLDYSIPANQVVQNPDNQWNTALQRYTPLFNGNHTLNITFDYDFRINTNFECFLRCVDTGSLLSTWFFEIQLNFTQWIPTNGIRQVFFKNEIRPGGDSSVQTGNVTLTCSLPMVQGDQITDIRIVQLQQPGDASGEPIPKTNTTRASWTKPPLTNTNPGSGYKPRLNMSNINLRIRPELEYNYGTPIFIDHYIPTGIKQRDFIKSIIDTYKLIVDVDATQDNKLIYKTRDTYYDEGRSVNWTDKIAKDRKINLEFLQDKQPKNLIFSYKPDTDPFNTAYTDATDQVYGQYRYTYENEYNVGEERRELIFSPTPIYRDQYSKMFLPAIVSEPDKNYNIRILFDNGERTDGFFFIFNPDGTVGQLRTSYPMATHLDDPINPGFDINFDRCAYYFYNDWDPMTQNNLFNLFHRRVISQLTKGRLMTAFFRLTPLDILDFKLNDKIFIHDTWFNVNRIIDYNANADQLTKVQLVTIDDGQSVIAQRSVGRGDIVPFTTNRTEPIKPNPTDSMVWRASRELTTSKRLTENTFSGGSNAMVTGTRNIISADYEGIIVGNRNITSNNRSMIIGNDNVVSEFNTKLVIGDNLIVTSEADVVAGKIAATQDLKVGNLDLTESGIIRIEQYMNDDYFKPNEYTVRTELSIVFSEDGIVSDNVYVGKSLIGLNQYTTVNYNDEGYFVTTETKINFNEDGVLIEADETIIDSPVFLPQITENLSVKVALIIDPATNEVFKRNVIPAFINYFDFDSASVTTITTADVFNKLNSDTTSLFSENGLVHSNNRITNTSHNKIIQAHAITSLEAGNNNIIHLAFFRGSDIAAPTIIPCSEQQTTIGANDKAHAVPIQCIFELDENEYVEVWVKNQNATTNITLVNLNVIVNEKLTS